MQHFQNHQKNKKHVHGHGKSHEWQAERLEHAHGERQVQHEGKNKGSVQRLVDAARRLTASERTPLVLG